jgi:Family of unknown function (DUF695)
MRPNNRLKERRAKVCARFSQIVGRKKAYRHGKPAEASGVIGKTVENGLPVIWSFLRELPSEAERRNLSWLIVIVWLYDGSERNGMPSEQVNQEMLKLEDALEELEVPGKHVSVYRRTGNDLKEFTFYARGTDEFMHSLNAALVSHSRYPIEIKFYEDKDWSDFRRLLADFDPAQQSVQSDRREDTAPG